MSGEASSLNGTDTEKPC